MHLHLDPVGGVAGDMFVAALLDLRPDLADAAIEAVRQVDPGPDIEFALLPFNDGTLSGSRFVVERRQVQAAHDHASHHHHDHGEHHHEHHVHWGALRERLAHSALDRAVSARAIAIFTGLAEAEARVHDKPVDDVAFHEVGAWDSIADIVASAFLIEALGPVTWSCGALPLGSGRVETAHGLLPVPAPATVLLLEGFACFDDGRPGERVTPTGAAILKHLAPTAAPAGAPRRLGGSGYGFGTRRLEGMSNVLRVVSFESTDAGGAERDSVVSIAFEIDDQTPEDLALALDRLRELDGVLDVTSHTATGKRGRQMQAVRLLVHPAQVDTATSACFNETTTLGLRLSVDERIVLCRRDETDDAGVRVKVAGRGDGNTAKAEFADLESAGGHAAREARRRAAEAAVLARDDDATDA